MKTRGARHNAREFALRILFGDDLYPAAEASLAATLSQSSWDRDDGFGVSIQSEKMGRELAMNTQAQQSHIDETIRAHSKNWRLERMSYIDRNILRLAVYELSFDQSAPVNVVIDEALELAKCYGEEKSSLFINGILDPIAAQLRGPIQ